MTGWIMGNFSINRLGCLCILGFVTTMAGCAANPTPNITAPAQIQTPAENSPAGAVQQTSHLQPKPAYPPIVLTNFIELFNCWPQSKVRKADTSQQQPSTILCGSGDGGLDAVELYTRLKISSEWPKKTNPDGSENSGVFSRNNQERDPLSRFFVGKDVTRILSVKVSIPEHNYTTVVPLLTIGHVSNREVGEQFDVLATESSIEGPFFRVGPTAKLSVSVEARTSTQYSSNAVKTVLAITKRLAEYTVPQSGVLTSLTKDKASINANATDDAISRLTSEQDKEEIRAGSDISRWSQDHYIQITARLPDEKADSPPLVGTWWVTLSTPRVSMFSNAEACDRTDKGVIICSEDTVKKAKAAAFGNVFPASVLNLSVGDNVRLDEYVSRQPWYSDYIARIGKGGKGRGQAARGFCANVVDTAYKLGLNRWDALVTLYAIVNTRLDDDGAKAVDENCQTYKAQAADIGLRVRNY